jgi:orotidine-5'-phosphate decarboxylase
VKQPKLYLALDTPDPHKAWQMARMVHGVEGDYGFKLNLDELLLNDAVHQVARFKEEFGRPIFTDTKTWNGARTMAEVAVGLGRAGSSLVNIYAQSGVKFMRRVMGAVQDSDVEIDVFALGVLTHYTEADCQRLYRRTLSATVRLFARDAAEAGADGYIQPGTVLHRTKWLEVKKLVPAVRPLWYGDTKANLQEQTVTPEQAFAGGADIVVCGSPVFKSEEPAEALHRLLEEID